MPPAVANPNPDRTGPPPAWRNRSDHRLGATRGFLRRGGSACSRTRRTSGSARKRRSSHTGSAKSARPARTSRCPTMSYLSLLSMFAVVCVCVASRYMRAPVDTMRYNVSDPMSGCNGYESNILGKMYIDQIVIRMQQSLITNQISRHRFTHHRSRFTVRGVL